MNKSVFVAILVAVLFGAGGFVGYSWAKRSADKAIAKAEIEYREKLQKAKAKEIVRIKYVNRTKTILQKVPDPTGCLDTAWPDEFTQRMRDHYSSGRN